MEEVAAAVVPVSTLFIPTVDAGLKWKVWAAVCYEPDKKMKDLDPPPFSNRLTILVGPPYVSLCP